MKELFEKRNLNDIVDDVFLKNDPDKVTMLYNDQAITFREVKEKLDYFIKNLIKLGIKKDAVVGYTMPNCPEAFYMIMALSKLGACAVPVFHMIPDMGKLGICAGFGANIIITFAAQFEGLKAAATQMGRPFKIATMDACDGADYQFSDEALSVDTTGAVLTEIDESQPLVFATSSGTTGVPKNLCMNQLNVATITKITYDLTVPFNKSENENGEHRSVLVFPLCGSGVLVCLGMMIAGLTQVFSEDMSPIRYLELIQRWKVDSMAAPPAYLENIINLPMLGNYDISTIHKVYTGMDFCPNKLLKRIREKFVNLTMAANGYGLMETTTVVMVWKANNVEELEMPTNSMLPVADVGNEIEVFDPDQNPLPVGEEGEVFIRGNSLINGYLGNEEETAKAFKDGWFRTGDVARKEEDGRISLLGRSKYVIKRGGRSVSPIVIKEHIDKLEEVATSAIVGVPNALFGEMVWAFVVKSKSGDVKEGDIVRHCRESLPPYMVPDHVTFVPEIPKNPGVGKVNFEKLKEMGLQEFQAMNGGNNG